LHSVINLTPIDFYLQ